MRFAFTAIDYPEQDPRHDCTACFYSGFSLVLSDEAGHTQTVPLLRNKPLRAPAPETYFAALGLKRGHFIARRNFRSNHEYVALTRAGLQGANLALDPALLPLLERIDLTGRYHYLTAPLAAFADDDWRPDFLSPGLAANGFFIFGLKSTLGAATETITLAVCGVLINAHGPSSVYELAKLAFDCETAIVGLESVHPGFDGSTILARLETLVKEHNRLARSGATHTPLLSGAGMDGLRTRFARDVICTSLEVS